MRKINYFIDTSDGRPDNQSYGRIVLNSKITNTQFEAWKMCTNEGLSKRCFAWSVPSRAQIVQKQSSYTEDHHATYYIVYAH